MKIYTLRLFVILLTFSIGLSSTLFWVYYSYQPKVKVIENTFIPEYPEYARNQITKSDKEFWNKEILGRFKEQPLEITADSIDESYRFTLIPTFDAPVSIRIWRSGDKQFLTVKKLSGEGGFGLKKFGKLSYHQTRELSEDEWLKFTSLIDDSWFWSEPSLIFESPECDGAEWIMEGISQNQGRGRNYHEVHRRISKKELQEVCNYLLKLARIKAEYQDY